MRHLLLGVAQAKYRSPNSSDNHHKRERKAAKGKREEVKFLAQVTGVGFLIAVLWALLWGFVVKAPKKVLGTELETSSLLSFFLSSF